MFFARSMQKETRFQSVAVILCSSRWDEAQLLCVAVANRFHISERHHRQHYIIWMLGLIPAIAPVDIIIKPHISTQATNSTSIRSMKADHTAHVGGLQCRNNTTNYCLIIHTYICLPSIVFSQVSAVVQHTLNSFNLHKLQLDLYREDIRFHCHTFIQTCLSLWKGWECAQALCKCIWHVTCSFATHDYSSFTM